MLVRNLHGVAANIGLFFNVPPTSRIPVAHGVPNVPMNDPRPYKITPLPYSLGIHEICGACRIHVAPPAVTRRN
jgi:hypothetical protein